MNFVNYSTNSFSNLNNTPQVIVGSTINTLYINSITVCNIEINDIRINLVKKINSDSGVKQSFMVKNILLESSTNIKPDVKSTINLVSSFGLEIFLPIMNTGGITYTTELICYSNGITQNFDCTVDYTTFVETPIL